MSSLSPRPNTRLQFDAVVENTKDQPSDDMIALAITFIHENWNQPLTLNELADVTSMSPFHFARRFHERMGITPHKYVLSLRVARAKELLSRPRHEKHSSITSVALTCGFYDASHFTRMFKRFVGMTPSQFVESSNVNG